MTCRMERLVRLVRQLTTVVAASSVWGCAINPTLLLSEHAAGLPATVHLEAPFHPQTEFQCGPAALATVLGASGVDVEPEELKSQVFIPGRQGSLQVELLAAARTRGRIPFELKPEVGDIMEEIAAGRPVLVLQNLGIENTPIWHYAVITGYEQKQNRLRFNSGKRDGLWLHAPEFLRTWNWASRWAIVTLEPGDYPVSAELSSDVSSYLRAVVNFDKVAGSDAAEPAWLAAAGLWPHESMPPLALGNIAYGRQDLATAVHWYRRGLATQEYNPALANNLASVLGEAGCARAGERVLTQFAREVSQQDPLAESIRATLSELAEQREPDKAHCAELI